MKKSYELKEIVRVDGKLAQVIGFGHEYTIVEYMDGNMETVQAKDDDRIIRQSTITNWVYS